MHSLATERDNCRTTHNIFACIFCLFWNNIFLIVDIRSAIAFWAHCNINISILHFRSLWEASLLQRGFDGIYLIHRLLWSWWWQRRRLINIMMCWIWRVDWWYEALEWFPRCSLIYGSSFINGIVTFYSNPRLRWMLPSLEPSPWTISFIPCGILMD